ncbi:hypothetical protein EJ110_NYTH28896 [Nymphaea thermarum]|nr:hypothetical protein EJ110_NYTH28896 [Nymphaea thermarum]
MSIVHPFNQPRQAGVSLTPATLDHEMHHKRLQLKLEVCKPSPNDADFLALPLLSEGIKLQARPNALKQVRFGGAHLLHQPLRCEEQRLAGALYLLVFGLLFWVTLLAGVIRRLKINLGFRLIVIRYSKDLGANSSQI